MQTLASRRDQPNRHIVASITPSPDVVQRRLARDRGDHDQGRERDAALPIVDAAFGDDVSHARAERRRGYPVTISLNKAVTAPLTVVLALRRQRRAGQRLHVAGWQHRHPAGPDVADGADPDRPRQRGRVGPRVDRRAGVELRVPDRHRRTRARVTIESEVMPELTLTGEHARGRRRRRGDVHDHRRPGAGEEHVGELPGASAPRSRARTSSRWWAPRSCGPGSEAVTVDAALDPEGRDVPADRHDRRDVADPRSGRCS